jgi:two-component system sensor histidine kinase YesM
MNKKLKNAAKDFYDRSSLTSKIRYSYLVILIPIFLFLLFCFYNLWAANYRYQDMINSTVAASEFTLDFKKDFDYETYLLIVGNKTVEESELRDMLTNANRIITGLEQITDSKDNLARLKSIKKYLNNLDTYVDRIEQNIRAGNRYEDNMEIWENDIQIVTTLVRETIFQYIYYEIKGIQESHAEYQSFFVSMIEISVIAFVAVLLLIVFISHYIPLSISRPITELVEVTQQVSQGNLQVRSHVNTGVEAKQLSESLNTMIDKINALLEQVKKEQIRIRKAEFELLQAQINPHFLYNTLDTIIWLAESDEQKQVVHMVESLSDFFRTSLNQGKDIISIKEEIQHVRSYLEIQQMRYQDILEYEIDVPEEFYQNTIPKITVQPLVENALYHGIKNKRGKGKITVRGYREDSFFILEVRDNGIGMQTERLVQVRNALLYKQLAESKVYGLYNVNERIRLNCGEEYGLRISSTYQEGTTVKILLPDADSGLSSLEEEIQPDS